MRKRWVVWLSDPVGLSDLATCWTKRGADRAAWAYRDFLTGADEDPTFPVAIGVSRWRRQ